MRIGGIARPQLDLSSRYRVPTRKEPDKRRSQKAILAYLQLPHAPDSGLRCNPPITRVTITGGGMPKYEKQNQCIPPHQCCRNKRDASWSLCTPKRSKDETFRATFVCSASLGGQTGQCHTLLHASQKACESALLPGVLPCGEHRCLRGPGGNIHHSLTASATTTMITAAAPYCTHMYGLPTRGGRVGGLAGWLAQVIITRRSTFQLLQSPCTEVWKRPSSFLDSNARAMGGHGCGIFLLFSDTRGC